MRGHGGSGRVRQPCHGATGRLTRRHELTRRHDREETMGLGVQVLLGLLAAGVIVPAAQQPAVPPRRRPGPGFLRSCARPT